MPLPAIALVLLLTGPDVEAPLPAPPLVEAQVSSDRPAQGRTHFGVMIDAGLPDGFGASAVYRPWYWLRLHAGATTTTLSTGGRAGFDLVPFDFWVTPALSLEAGFMPGANWNRAAQVFGAGASFHQAALDDISYKYANAQLGLEFGPPRRFTFYVRGGLSYVNGSVGGLRDALAQQDSTLSAKSATVQMVIPSARLGFIVYFL